MKTKIQIQNQLFTIQVQKVMSKTEARIQEQCVAAMGASVVAALVTNPFDVVKTRLQVQLGNPQTQQKGLFFHEKLVLSGCGSSTCPRSISPSPTTSCSIQCFFSNSSFETMRRIVRREGIFVLWRGTAATMMASIPLVGIYMPLYESMLQGLNPLMGAYAPLLAGSAARSVSVLCVAPLELIRTRIQASPRQFGIQSNQIQQRNWLTGSGQIRWLQMWRGVDATLARDIPFSMIYWMLVEPIRKAVKQQNIQNEDDLQTLITANVLAGSIAGSVAAVLTTPFDVAKTTVQAKHEQDSVGSVLRTMRDIYRAGGVQSLFAGVGPRVTKIAPACAIVISMYEILKQSLAGKLGF
eukprot:TRINITY_DN15955_c0_g1_i6.p1 TRINITY_DN15955_c0_g1~~TRINITY_DN15955_c0_g1_i6.p1  ORF type:complete len:353 (-),score=28.19 TRINITY_DN15955_c0_g1_i6:251-1309(-)